MLNDENYDDFFLLDDRENLNDEQFIEDGILMPIETHVETLLDTIRFNGLINNTAQQTTTSQSIRRGRKRNNNSSNPIHTKDNIDNKIRKIRIHAIKFGMELINDCIKHYYPNWNRFLKGITKEITSDINIFFIIDFFQYTLEKIYSNKLNTRYKNHNSNSNIETIEELKKKNNPVINSLLNMTFNELFNLFVESDKEKLKEKYYLSKAKTFEDFINEKLKNEDEKYINDIRKIANNYLGHFKENKARYSEKRKDKLNNTNFSNCRQKNKCEK